MLNYVLYGFKASGKTSYGKLLAERLSRPFFDVDDLLRGIYLRETGHAWTVREIYKEEQEQSFRDWESKAVCQLGDISGAVIALGGGTPLRQENCDLLKSGGLWVYIDEERHRLEERCPPFWMSQYEVRKPIYEKLADVHFRPSGKSISHEIDRLMEAIAHG